MSWKIVGTMMLTATLAACAVQNETQIASIVPDTLPDTLDARCAAIATTGDDYRYCVEQSGRSAQSRPEEILQALQSDR